MSRISALNIQTATANDNITIWQYRRTAAGALWRDAQWAKFDRLCGEEIKTLLSDIAKAAERLDSELTAAVNQMNSV